MFDRDQFDDIYDEDRSDKMSKERIADMVPDPFYTETREGEGLLDIEHIAEDPNGYRTTDRFGTTNYDRDAQVEQFIEQCRDCFQEYRGRILDVDIHQETVEKGTRYEAWILYSTEE